jgi:hypothetical protein
MYGRIQIYISDRQHGGGRVEGTGTTEVPELQIEVLIGDK